MIKPTIFWAFEQNTVPYSIYGTSGTLLYLAEIIPWSEFEQAFAKHYSPDVGAPCQTDSINGSRVQLLKYLFKMSDEKIVGKFKQNPY